MLYIYHHTKYTLQTKDQTESKYILVYISLLTYYGYTYVLAQIIRGKYFYREDIFLVVRRAFCS